METDLYKSFQTKSTKVDFFSLLPRKSAVTGRAAQRRKLTFFGLSAGGDLTAQSRAASSGTPSTKRGTLAWN